GVQTCALPISVQYESVLEEHRAVRQGVGVFDVSHLGRLEVTGPNSTEILRNLFTNDVAKYEPGRTHYTMLLNDDGGIVDDIVVWRWDEDHYWVMPNAANADRVRATLEDRGAHVVDLRPSTCLLAVQGPAAPRLIEETFGQAPARFRTLEVDGVRMAGTGYTGERGGEVCLPIEAAGPGLEELLEAGAVPCGLGARDTLRLEAGLALWGSDIDETTTPLEAGLDFAVDWDHDFPGKTALECQRQTGPSRRLTGLVMEGRGIPRHGYAVRSGRRATSAPPATPESPWRTCRPRWRWGSRQRWRYGAAGSPPGWRLRRSTGDRRHLGRNRPPPLARPARPRQAGRRRPHVLG